MSNLAPLECMPGSGRQRRGVVRVQIAERDGLAASKADLDTLTELCDMVRRTSLCGLGQSAPNPVISTLRYFREEYESKLVKDGNHER